MEALYAQAVSYRINYNLKSFSLNFGTVTSAGCPQEQNTLTLSYQVTPGNGGGGVSRMSCHGVTGFPGERDIGLDEEN